MIAVVLTGFGIQSRAIGRLDRKIDGIHGRLDRKIDGIHGGLDRKIDGIHGGLDRKIDGVRDELRAEIRDGFAKTETRLTAIEQRTYDISLRLPPAAKPHTG
ncbi:hypothetical protein [Aeromicrobium sp. CTD01-1L150]|uniref:hypothetical protein n=1 Tax=Aeromicrobium sp. CTD01-1L150 TaxID=3341830 RepID=UPI0035BED142